MSNLGGLLDEVYADEDNSYLWQQKKNWVQDRTGLHDTQILPADWIHFLFREGSEKAIILSKRLTQKKQLPLLLIDLPNLPLTNLYEVQILYTISMR